MSPFYHSKLHSRSSLLRKSRSTLPKLSGTTKSSQDIAQGGLNLIPREWAAFENYSEALSATPLLQYMLNGVIVTVCIFTLQVVIALPCAYALAKLRWRGRGRQRRGPVWRCNGARGRRWGWRRAARSTRG